jgi:hypothetical protein
MQRASLLPSGVATMGTAARWHKSICNPHEATRRQTQLIVRQLYMTVTTADLKRGAECGTKVRQLSLENVTFAISRLQIIEIKGLTKNWRREREFLQSFGVRLPRLAASYQRRHILRVKRKRG